MTPPLDTLSTAEPTGRPAAHDAGPLVTVIVPCRDEERYVGPCLESIMATAYPQSRLEVLVVDGRSRDGTRSIVEAWARAHAQIRLLDNPRRIVPAALNLGIRAARGDVIVRMDAHVVYPPHYIPRLVAALAETGADNVGARIVTLPADPGAVARGIAIALSHPFGVGNSYFRIGTTVRRRVDTVPFGCYRRDVFDRFGLFDEDLVRNQDDEFNHRVVRHGGRILLLPDVESYYYARPSLRQLARMYYQYGLFKPLTARKVGRVMTVRQLVPAAFVLTVAVLAALGLVWTPAAILAALTAGSYALAVALAALPTLATHGVRCALVLALAFPILHVSYGIGFLRGLGFLFRRPPGRAAALPLSR